MFGRKALLSRTGNELRTECPAEAVPRVRKKPKLVLSGSDLSQQTNIIFELKLACSAVIINLVSMCRRSSFWSL